MSSIPSYTQLGMASLLPKGDIGLSDFANASITHNDLPTVGIENRKKALSNLVGSDRLHVCRADCF